MSTLTHNSTTNRRQTVKESSKRINITSCNTSTNLHKGVNNVHWSNNRTLSFFPPVGLHGPHQGGHWDRAIVNNRHREDGLAWVGHGNLSSTPWNNVTCHLRENSPNLVSGRFRQDQYTRPFSGTDNCQCLYEMFQGRCHLASVVDAWHVEYEIPEEWYWPKFSVKDFFPVPRSPQIRHALDSDGNRTPVMSGRWRTACAIERLNSPYEGLSLQQTANV